MSPRKNITAAELDAKLAADPEFQERKKLRDAEFRLREERLSAAERPIVEALHNAGFEVASVWDFISDIRDPRPTPAAAARVMLQHLRLPYPDKIKEGIGRALAVTEPHDGWKILVEEFESNPDRTAGGSKFGVALALAAAADLKVIDDIVRLVRDKRQGEARVPLLWALKLMNEAKSRVVLRELTSDPEIGLEARRTLKRKTGYPVPRKNESR